MGIPCTCGLPKAEIDRIARIIRAQPEYPPNLAIHEVVTKAKTGAGRVLTVLEHIQEDHDDPREQVSPEGF